MFLNEQKHIIGYWLLTFMIGCRLGWSREANVQRRPTLPDRTSRPSDRLDRTSSVLDPQQDIPKNALGLLEYSNHLWSYGSFVSWYTQCNVDVLLDWYFHAVLFTTI
jgi:hypothetical protein